MGRYKYEASIYQNNANNLNSILKQTSSDIDTISELLRDSSDDVLLGDVITMNRSIKTKINTLETNLNSIASSLNTEASRLDYIEEQYYKKLNEEDSDGELVD